MNNKQLFFMAAGTRKTRTLALFAIINTQLKYRRYLRKEVKHRLTRETGKSSLKVFKSRY